MSVTAFDALGGEFLNARNALVAELAALLQRIPKLTSLSFSDGTRFADPATGDWIEGVVMPLAAGESGGAVSGASFSDDGFEIHFNEAKKMLDAGDLAGAIALLQAGANNDTSRKSAFRRKLAIATLCMRGNQPAIARPLLESLNEEVDRFSIAEWEPPLALDVLKHLHSCYQSLAGGTSAPNKQGLQQLADKVFEKICRLDVGYALASTGTKPKQRPKIPASLPKSEGKSNNGAGTVEAPDESEKVG
jgi:type VI secretion system protein VasJ